LANLLAELDLDLDKVTKVLHAQLDILIEDPLVIIGLMNKS
jgi:hypothetical protein